VKDEKHADAEPKDERLVCVECGRRSAPGAYGWRAVLAGFGGDEEVGVYCPECAAREVGGRIDVGS
jgi:hypothetical protein